MAVGAGLVLLGWRKVDNRPVGEPEPFDTTGLVVLMVGLTALLVALMQALTWGWDSAATLALFGAGLAVLAAFASFELGRAHPLLDLNLLRKRIAGRATDRVGARTRRSSGLILLSASIAPMFTSLLTGLANAVQPEERGDANALVLTVRWIGAAAGTMVLGVVIHSGGGATPTASPYATAFTILAALALAGAAACALLLLDRRAGS